MCECVQEEEEERSVCGGGGGGGVCGWVWEGGEGSIDAVTTISQ